MSDETIKCVSCGEEKTAREIYGFRGVYACASCIEDVRARREEQRESVIDEYNHSVRSQAEGEWMNGGYRYMKTDSGRPVTETKTPHSFTDYEDGKL